MPNPDPWRRFKLLPDPKFIEGDPPKPVSKTRKNSGRRPWIQQLRPRLEARRGVWAEVYQAKTVTLAKQLAERWSSWGKTRHLEAVASDLKVYVRATK